MKMVNNTAQLNYWLDHGATLSTMLDFDGRKPKTHVVLTESGERVHMGVFHAAVKKGRVVTIQNDLTGAPMQWGRP